MKNVDKEIRHWKMIANDLWWRLDDVDGDEAVQALEDWPELGETEEYLGSLLEKTFSSDRR